MTKKSESLKIGLLDNASHSLKRGFQMWMQWRESEDAWLLKEAVIWVHHGIELILKQLLVQTNEFLVFQDVNKAVERLGILRKKSGMRKAGVLDLFDHDEKVTSVGFRNLIERAAITLSIPELEEGEPLRTRIDRLTRYRNKIVHYSLDLDVVEVSGMLSDLLNPLLSLLAREMNDPNFRKNVIPEIRRLAQPIAEYLEFIRSSLAESAVHSAKLAVPPQGNGKAGIVVQAAGSGLSLTLLKFLAELNKLPEFNNDPLVVLADRRVLVDQLCYTITENSDLRPAVPNTYDELIALLDSSPPKIVITTTQQFKQDEIANKRAVFIGYNMHSIPEKLVSFWSSGVRILFAHMPTLQSIDAFGDVVGCYVLQQAMLDNILRPIKIERAEFASDHKVYESIGAFNHFQSSLDFFAPCVSEIVRHFTSSREIKGGKGIIIVRNIEAAKSFLDAILKLRPDWRGDDIRSMVVNTVSSGNSLKESRFILDTFRDEKASLLLLIGTGSYLEGYDNRFINTVYVTCPISNRLQYKILSLVGRHNEEKSEGAIVDLVGLDWSMVTG